jgi:hypothetical protein
VHVRVTLRVRKVPLRSTRSDWNVVCLWSDINSAIDRPLATRWLVDSLPDARLVLVGEVEGR